MKRILYRVLIIMEVGLFFSCSIAKEKIQHGSSTVDMFNVGDTLPSVLSKEQNMYVSTDAKNDLKEDTLICNEEILLVVESSVDSLFCLPFIPDHYDDCIWAFPSHPATYPEVSPIEKSIKALENELKIQLVEYRTFFNVLQSILVVIDAEGLPRGIILFVEKDQKDVIAQLGKEILGFLKKERFSPGIDIEAEIGKPIPDIMVINLVDGR